MVFKYLFFLFIFVFSAGGETPSTNESASQLKLGERDVVFDMPFSFSMENIFCVDCRITNRSSDKGVKDLCEVIINSAVCKKVEDKEDLLDCKNPYQSRQFDVIDFFVGCVKGAFWEAPIELIKFVWSALKWAWNSVSHPVDTAKEAMEYAESMKLYLVNEYDKAYDKADSSFKEVKAAKAVGYSIAQKLFQSIEEAVSSFEEEFNCLNFKARTEKICTLAGEFLIPPAAALALLKYGVKGVKLKAHALVKKDGKKESKTASALKPNEVRIEDHGSELVFKSVTKDGRLITETKTVGSEVSIPRALERENGHIVEIKDGKVKVDFKNSAGETRSEWFDVQQLDVPVAKSSFIPENGDTVSFPRSNGGISTGRIRTVSGDMAEVTFEENGKIFSKEVPIQSLNKPVALPHINLGDEISFPRSESGRSNGVVTEVIEGSLKVEFTDLDGVTKYKWIPSRYARGSVIQGISGRTIPKIASEQKLLPEGDFAPIEGGNASVKTGKFFQDSDGRVFTIAEVDVRGESKYRVFYRSGSQGTFRLLPARNKEINIPGYDKGDNENMLTASPELQALLSKKMAGTDIEKLPVINPENLEGILPVNRNMDDWMDYKKSEDYVSSKHFQTDKILNSNTDRSLSDTVDRSILHPKNVSIKNPNQRPDYNKLKTSYTFQSTLYGKVQAYVYKSKDGSMEYTLFKTGNRVWFGDVGYANTPITSHGLRKKTIDAEELTTPLWEYRDFIPEDYVGGPHSSQDNYHSAWKYIREMPDIQRWYRENNMRIPE